MSLSNGHPTEPIVRLRHTHEAFMDWMLLNPGASLQAMAAEFGYTVSWLSTVINSDLFQMRLAERRSEIDLLVHADIPTKMRGIVAQGLDKVAMHMEKTQDMEYVTETTDKLLHRLGYAPKATQAAQQAPTNQQNNFFLVSPSDLAAARQRIHDQSHAAGADSQLVRSEARVIDQIQGNTAEVIIVDEIAVSETVVVESGEIVEEPAIRRNEWDGQK